MSHVHVDNPGEWRWWPNRGPAPVIGLCPHACSHESQQVIAWGPDVKHYELVQCDAICAGSCRAWTDGTIRTTTPWQQVAVPERASS